MLFVALALAHPTEDARLVAIGERMSTSGLEPADAELHRLRAAVFEDRGDVHSALVALEAVEACGGTDVDLPRGRLLLLAGDAGSALAVADLVSLGAPDRGGAWLLRARARVALGDIGGARDDYARATERLDDLVPDLWLERAENARRAGYGAELPAIADAAAARAQPVEALEALAFSAELEADPVAAARRADAATGRFFSAPWLARRAEALDRLGRSEDALFARAEARRALFARFPRAPRPQAVTQLLIELEAHLEPDR